MRLALVTDAWEPQINGVVRTLRHTIAELEAAGVSVVRISPEQFSTVPCPSYPTIRLALFQDAKVAKALDAAKPDAVHIATEGPLGFAARSWCIRRRLKFTTSYHTNFPDYLRARWPVPRSVTYAYLRWFHRPATRVMVATPAIRGLLASQGFKRLKLWSRGVDTELFRPLAARQSQGVPIFVYLGRVAVEKNVEAFLSLDLPGRMVVIGDGPALEPLQRRFSAVQFTGHLEGSALVEQLGRADVMVFPSLTDTFGLVLLEAMACAVPVAAFPVPGPVDVVVDGITGALDQDLRSAAMRALSLDRDQCRRHAETRSWSGATREFLSNLTPARRAAARRFRGLKNAEYFAR
jgi:glycosyltransferase involved in cell wall biosynthesis